MQTKCEQDQFYNPLIKQLGSDIFKSSSNYASCLSTSFTPLTVLAELVVIGAEFDPLLDDAIELAKEWPNKNVGQVVLEIARGLPHGFLRDTSSNANAAIQLTIDKIKDMIIDK